MSGSVLGYGPIHFRRGDSKSIEAAGPTSRPRARPTNAVGFPSASPLLLRRRARSISAPPRRKGGGALNQITMARLPDRSVDRSSPRSTAALAARSGAWAGPTRAGSPPHGRPTCAGVAPQRTRGLWGVLKWAGPPKEGRKPPLEPPDAFVRQAERLVVRFGPPRRPPNQRDLQKCPPTQSECWGVMACPMPAPWPLSAAPGPD